MTNPILIDTPFASNGKKNTIQDEGSVTSNRASWDQGWTEVTSRPIKAGGMPPEREDFNGVLFAITDNITHQSKGLGYEFDADFAEKIGGYPIGARLRNADGDEIVNTVAGNKSSSEGWQKKSEQVATVSDLPTNAKDGQVVFVQSYLPPNFAEATPLKGGGLFVYDSSKKDINNGVTLLNGWVRCIFNNTITTDDAGLKGDGTDTTDKLQSVADSVADGFSIEFIGEYNVTTSIYFDGKNNLKINSNNGSIKGDKANWVWGEAINGTNRRGLFVFKDCDNLDIESLVVKGIQKNIFGSFQDGDSCIQMIDCFNPKIKLCTLTHSFAWAVVGEGCQFPVVEYNVISDVVHQSGINVCVGGGKNAKVNFNHITNCGLYGVEFETYTALSDDTFESFGNIISDCYAGITATGNGVTKGVVIGNSIEKCGYTAIMLQNILNTKAITIFNNPLTQNWRGAILKECPNTQFSYNPIRGIAIEDIYLKINPDWFVLKVMSSRTFIIQRGSVTAGTKIYINSKEYTASTVVNYTDESGEFSSGDAGSIVELSLVTVDIDITDDSVLNRHLQRKVLSGSKTEANITIQGGSNQLVVSNNTMSGGNYCFYYNQNSAPTSASNVYVYDNDMIDFGINAILHDVSTSHVFYRGNKTNSLSTSVYVIHEDLIKNGSFETKSLRQVVCSAQTETDHAVTSFGLDKSYLIVGATACFEGGATNGLTAVKFNDASASIAIQPSDGLTIGEVYKVNAVLTKGLNKVELTDTVGDLVFSSAYVDLLIPA